MRIAVTGATGFVGRHIVRALLARGHQVRALVRREPPPRFPAGAAVEFVHGTLADPAALDRLAAETQALIHLVGIIVERGRNTFEAVHVEGTRAVVAAARNAGGVRLVHMSAVGARDEPGATPYHRTKWRAERLALQSGLAATVFRPSIINGPGNVPIRTLARLHRFFPLVPMFGTGTYPVQPVWIEDVALAFALAAERTDAGGIFQLGGPEVLTYADFVRAIGRAAGHPRPLVRVPLALVRLAATGFDRLGHLAPLTSGQLQMLVEGSATPDNALPAAFDIVPLTFEEGLRRFLP